VLKRVSIIFLLIIYLTSISEFTQWIKVPVLFEHYVEHKTLNPHLTFLSFLNMHYSMEDDQDSDYDHDSQLPFKSHSGCINSGLIAFLPEFAEEINKNQFISGELHFIPSPESLLPQTILSSVWQPPKTC